MAIDANIVLQGIVPNVGRAVGEGMQIGQSIRNAPLLRRLKKQQIAQGEQLGELRGQQIAQGELTQGQNEATTVFSIFGEQEITPENFGQATRVLQRQGVPLEEDDLINSPENVQTINQLRLQGKSFAQQSRGAGQTGFSTNAPIITEETIKDENGKEIVQKYFTAFQTNRATGESRAVKTPISGTITDRLGLNAGDRVNEAQQTEIAKTTGKAIGEAGTVEQKASTAAEIASRTKLSKDQARRIGEDIDKGTIAADSVPNLSRALSLLESVETGGFENAQLRGKQLFGIEAADEGELNNALKTAVLKELRPTFGAAFTAPEGERLESISQSFGRNTQTNIRLLKKIKEINEVAAQRGIDAAVKAKDYDRAKQIQEALDFKFSFEDEDNAKRQRLDALRAKQ